MFEKVKWSDVSRREILKAGTAAAAVAGTPLAAGQALAGGHGSENDKIVASAKKAVPGGQDLTGLMWGLYSSGAKPVMDEFGDLTGIKISKLQDISAFEIPQRAMAEALSKSPEFDFFHVDTNMIPSLASAGLLEPLDEYMKSAGFSINAVGDFGKFLTYKGKTYGITTDGNVHVQFIRSDLWNDPDERKAFADKHGRELTWPDTWEEDLEIMKFFHRPDKDLYGTASLRDRGSSTAWWYMYLYSAGGFPFTDDMDPNIDNEIGEYAFQTYLDLKQVSHPEAAGWGTPQMIPRIVNGQAFSCQYWDGIIALAENPKKSKTTGKWAYGPVPGSKKSGKLIKRSISTPNVGILVNRHSPRKAAMAHMAMYLGTAVNSAKIVGDPVNTFHDPWHVDHFKDGSLPSKVYTPGGMKAIKQNLQIVTPPIFLTGLLEFETELKRNFSEMYAGDKTAKKAASDTSEAWAKSIRRIGKRRLKEELATYKSLFPSVDVPA
jgi:multiple sugar transport system substrate-binding protein